MADESRFDEGPVLGRSSGPHLHFHLVTNPSGRPEIVLGPAESKALAKTTQDRRTR